MHTYVNVYKNALMWWSLISNYLYQYSFGGFSSNRLDTVRVDKIVLAHAMSHEVVFINWFLIFSQCPQILKCVRIRQRCEQITPNTKFQQTCLRLGNNFKGTLLYPSNPYLYAPKNRGSWSSRQQLNHRLEVCLLFKTHPILQPLSK